MKIITYEPGHAPEVEFSGSIEPSRLTRREKNTLLLAGVWEGSVDGTRHDWLKEATDGSVWAGGASGKVAKVRGKDGRRLAGRSALPEDEKRKTTSIQLAAREREKLEHLAAKATKAEGKRVSISGVVERLVRRA